VSHIIDEEVDESQDKIAEIIRRLEESGEIMIPHGGENDGYL
jgi:flagellar motor switch protein FliG